MSKLIGSGSVEEGVETGPVSAAFPQENLSKTHGLFDNHTKASKRGSIESLTDSIANTVLSKSPLFKSSANKVFCND